MGDYSEEECIDMINVVTDIYVLERTLNDMDHLMDAARRDPVAIEGNEEKADLLDFSRKFRDEYITRLQDACRDFLGLPENIRASQRDYINLEELAMKYNLEV